MARYSEQTIEKVNRNADIRDFIEGADPTKATQKIDCPFCGEKKKFSVTHNSRRNMAYCFSCKKSLSSPIAAWMHYQGYGNDKFPQAVEEVAKKAGIPILSEKQERSETIRKAGADMQDSFCVSQLAESGLTLEDVMATVIDNKVESLMSPFRPGSFAPGYRLDPKGSDMVIHYYDLNGRPMMFSAKGSTVQHRYVRVRYANPANHEIKGKPMKYQTPAGASCRAYIPQYIRNLYQSRTPIETLFLQEGEKKAEKACKHGMPSIGIQGINNIGSVNSGLLEDIQEVIKVCEVRNVVLMMDSDWDGLHRDLTVGDRLDKRPNSFAAAVVKFNNFMKSLRNIDIDVEAWWGHVNENNTFADKGIDDLLCNTLKLKEDELMPDATAAMNSTNGIGKYVTIVKISTMTDMKIRDLWSLNDHQAFFIRHQKQVGTLSSFRIGGIRYKVEDGKMVEVSRFSSDEDIYSVTENDKGAKKVSLNYLETMRLLAAAGFGRVLDSEVSSTSYDIVQIVDGVVDRVPTFKVRDFVWEYVVSNVKERIVLEFFSAKLDTALQDKKLERLPIIDDEFNVVEPMVQRTYYNNGQVEITSKGIIPEKPINNVWRSRIVPRDFRRVPIVDNIEKVGECYTIRYSDAARRCEFLQYLINTSNNYYPHNAPRQLTDDEYWEWNQHVVNKMTAIGYLLAEWKPSVERKVVVVQDHQMDVVGQSNGGSGKSLVGNAISKIIPQVFIAGSTFKKDDQFVFSSVNKTTRNIFIDDIRPNFDFKHIYPMVTGDMEINPKGKDRYQIPVDKSPKMLITTNHTINGASQDASRRRIIYMEYSSWYNPDHTPVDDFKHMLFDDWDADQWNLFDNFMAECVMYYFRAHTCQWHQAGMGAVPPPMKQIELRPLRQEMGETFLQWAEEYYDPSGFKLNERILRNDVFNSFIEFAGPTGHGVTRSNIWERMKKFASFKGYDLNINKPDKKGRYYNDFKREHPDDSFIGINDKSGGKEYFTVYSPDKKPTNTSVTPF